jgi:hypothetical protein
MEHFASKVPTEIIFPILGIPDVEVEDLAKDSEVRYNTSRNTAPTCDLLSVQQSIPRWVHLQYFRPKKFSCHES